MKAIKKMLLALTAAFAFVGSKLATATAVIANDTLEGLPALGTQLGSFLTNLAPGVGAFIIIIGVFGGVAAIVYAIVSVVKNKVRM